MSTWWWIKQHAAERWIERFRPGLTVEEARAELAALVPGCIEVERAVADGRREYLHPAWPTARFLVGAPDAPGYPPALVTVLDARGPTQNARSRKGLSRCQRQRFRRGDRHDDD